MPMGRPVAPAARISPAGEAGTTLWAVDTFIGILYDGKARNDDKISGRNPAADVKY
jgi:hypothetical protein